MDEKQPTTHKWTEVEWLEEESVVLELHSVGWALGQEGELMNYVDLRTGDVYQCLGDRPPFRYAFNYGDRFCRCGRLSRWWGWLKERFSVG